MKGTCDLPPGPEERRFAELEKERLIGHEETMGVGIANRSPRPSPRERASRPGTARESTRTRPPRWRVVRGGGRSGRSRLAEVRFMLSGVDQRAARSGAVARCDKNRSSVESSQRRHGLLERLKQCERLAALYHSSMDDLNAVVASGTSIQASPLPRCPRQPGRGHAWTPGSRRHRSARRRSGRAAPARPPLQAGPGRRRPLGSHGPSPTQ